MDWRSPFRRWIGEEDSLGPVKMAVLRLIDPVEAHMRSSFAEHDAVPRRGRRNRGGWYAYAPATERRDGALPVPPERPETSLEEDMRAWKAFRERYRGFFEAKARELIAGRDVVIETTRGTVRARLTRYRGGAVFENWRTAPDHEGNGAARIEPDEPDVASALVDHLVNAVLDLGADTEPLT
ncbi:MAG: hypothetical protein ACM3OO_04460 [Planctomycetaceae bacterium]